MTAHAMTTPPRPPLHRRPLSLAVVIPLVILWAVALLVVAWLLLA